MNEFRAGGAARSLEPPVGLPMPGFVRDQEGATGWGLPLETTAIVLEAGAIRVVLCGVDTLCIQAPVVDLLRARVAEAVGAVPAGVLLNWNHTHRAPPSSQEFLKRSGLLVTDGDSRTREYAEFLGEQVVAVAKDAAMALEPARVAWGVGVVDGLSVNRRDRDSSGRVVHGWREGALLDRQVVSLQARRHDETAIATLVCFGCHTVSVGMDVPLYSSDYPGALRRAVRSLTGGEAVFFQGAGGNVNPLFAFCSSESGKPFGWASGWPWRLGIPWQTGARGPGGSFARWMPRSFPLSIFALRKNATNLRVWPLPRRASHSRPSFPLACRGPRDRGPISAAALAAEKRGAGAAEKFGLYHAKWAGRLADDLGWARSRLKSRGRSML